METTLLLFAMALLIGANLAAALMIWVHKRIVNAKAKGVLETILFYLDEFCDNVEKPSSRARVIMALQSVLGFGIAGKRIFLPAVVVGWILNAEVKILRWLQVPDLHKNEEAQP